MVYRGIVKNGVVVLGEGVDLPDGMEVRIEPVARGESLATTGSTLAEQFGDVIGTVPDLRRTWPSSTTTTCTEPKR